MSGLYMLGTGFPEWKGNDVMAVTFQMGEDYDERGKAVPSAERRRMTWKTAKTFADYVLSDEMEYVPELVVEFAGVYGYAELDLMDRLSDYFVSRMGNRNQSLRFRLCTGPEEFQLDEIWRYLRKHENRLEVELILHDYLDVKEEVLYLWEKGVAEVFVHMEPDEEAEAGILEGQLKELADYALENQLFRRCSCNYFEEEITGCGLENEEKRFKSCGVMVTPSGKVYSLSRMIGCSYEKREKRLAGSVEAGVDPERIRPFCVISDWKTGRTEEGLRLERIRANEYYFAQLWKRYRIRREKGPNLQRMFIPLNNQYLPHAKATEQGGIVLTDRMLERSLSYCEKNGVEAVLIHPADELVKIDKPQLDRMRSIHVVPSAFSMEAAVLYSNVVPVSEKKIAEAKKGIFPERVPGEDVTELSELAVWDLLLEESDPVRDVIFHGSGMHTGCAFRENMMQE